MAYNILRTFLSDRHTHTYVYTPFYYSITSPQGVKAYDSYNMEPWVIYIRSYV